MDKLKPTPDCSEISKLEMEPRGQKPCLHDEVLCKSNAEIAFRHAGVVLCVGG